MSWLMSSLKLLCIDYMGASSRVLLISNSTLHGCGYLDHVEQAIRDFLGPVRSVLFFPFALQSDGHVFHRGREHVPPPENVAMNLPRGSVLSSALVLRLTNCHC